MGSLEGSTSSEKGRPNRIAFGDDDFLEVDFPLPRFFVRRDDGLFVDLEHFRDSSEFRLLVERLISAGCLFRDLDYPAFSALLFEFEPGVAIERLQRCKARDGSALLRWAAALERFDAARTTLYRAPRIEDDVAEYLFERLVIEVEAEVQPYGDGGEESPSATPDPGPEARVVEQETDLDADEFVIQMWLKGVRYGIDIEAVRKAIGQRWLGRMVIARGVPPEQGQDATVRELAEGLHRDDAPRVGSNGRVDLTQFRSRFPQVREGVRLVQKVPPVLGVPGRNVAGEPLEPAVPQNFEIEGLAGEGTRIEKSEGCEYLVAAMNGFLSIDHATNKMSISEKIINKQGVNIRTTGNLALMGDEYEEFGEIQEGRTVSGKSITTHADVYGRLVSSGGTIAVKRNLSGGCAINRDGPITVDGLAINAVLQAPRGEITVRHAENCVICGQRVVIVEKAVACDIHAREVEVAESEGSAIAGQKIVIGSARERRGNESLVSVIVPDLDGFARLEAALVERMKDLDEADERARQAAERARAQPDVARYLAIAQRVKSGEVKLRPEQLPAWDALARKAAPVLRALGALSSEVDARAGQRKALEVERKELAARREEQCTLAQLSIEQTSPGVIVRTMRRAIDSTSLNELPVAELRALIRSIAGSGQPEATPSAGSFEWKFTPGQ